MDQPLSDVVLIIADISGYTKYMMSTAKTLSHSQGAITELLESVVAVTPSSVKVSKFEGDAVFLYAVLDGDSDGLKEKIAEFVHRCIDVFCKRRDELATCSLCGCAACSNLANLKLKVFAHHGTALIHQVAGFEELSGVDVIVIHRLLKNTVASDQYILMTASAFRHLPVSVSDRFTESCEQFDDIGEIGTFVLAKSSTNEPIDMPSRLISGVQWTTHLWLHQYVVPVFGTLKNTKPIANDDASRAGRPTAMTVLGAIVTPFAVPMLGFATVVKLLFGSFRQ